MRDDAGVAATEMHVGHVGPLIGLGIVDFHALADEGAVVSTDGVQLAFEHADAGARTPRRHLADEDPLIGVDVVALDRAQALAGSAVVATDGVEETG